MMYDENPSPTFLKQRPLTSNLENKITSNTYWKYQLVCIRVQVHSFLEPWLEHNQDQLLPS